MRRCAGMTCIAQTTGRVLLLQRSQLVPQPGTWSCPAGGIDPGETPVEAAVRELGEEAGYWGSMVIDGPWVQRPKSGTFYHFVAAVPRQFRLKLNWENSDGGWFAWNSLPHPLHSGMVRFLRKL